MRYEQLTLFGEPVKPMKKYHVVVTVSYEVIVAAKDIATAGRTALDLDIGQQTLFDVSVDAVEKGNGG